MVDGRLRPELVTTQVAAIEDAVPALDQYCRDGAIKTILTASRSPAVDVAGRQGRLVSDDTIGGATMER
ncbi:MAG: hypothetical protein M3Y36_02700 [Actinomycetota bacterium]|nr:hypothetical protein [Actinomycetota bacterium]